MDCPEQIDCDVLTGTGIVVIWISKLLSLEVVKGFEATIRIRYPVPSEILIGILKLIWLMPEANPLNVPITVEFVKLPTESESTTEKTFPEL